MSASAVLQFDAERHEYRLAGRLVPSVTQVIRAVLPGWEASEWHMQRGTALHHGCRLLDQGVLDWQSVSPEIGPRIQAWQKFRKDSMVDVVSVETPLFSERYWFAGTCDRMLARGIASGIVCDLKSTIEPQVRVQLGGYSILWAARGAKPHAAVAVELRADGTYRCLWLDAAELRIAEQTFLAALTIHNFQINHKLTKGKA